MITRHGIFDENSMIRNYLATPDSNTTLYLRYHTDNKELEIGFKTKEVYNYINVPLRVWENYYAEVSTGGSSGKYFNQFIKDKYEFRR